MREVDAVEARKKLAELLTVVERGEEVMITRRRKPVAKRVPPDAGADPKKGLAAVQRIKELRKGITLGPGLTVKDLIDEGRR